MSAKSFIPDAVNYAQEIEELEKAGLKHLYSGKVRETFELPDDPHLLLFYATDRVSIFDIVLGALVPKKGYVLTAMTVMWLTKHLVDFPNHLVNFGSDIDVYLPKELRGNPDLQRRCMVVEKTDVLKVEAIVRGYITGSGYEDYLKTAEVCGHQLPAGLKNGDKLPMSLFTPSTKAEQGMHDENISFDDAAGIIGPDKAQLMCHFALSIYERAQSFAKELGIIIADTKFEFGVNEDGKIILIDEVLTPDSSRFWLEKDWKKAQLEGKAPQGFDKQFVREWGKGVGIKENPDQVPPEEIIKGTTKLYLEGFKILAGESLEHFQKEDMDISG